MNLPLLFEEGILPVSVDMYLVTIFQGWNRNFSKKNEKNLRCEGISSEIDQSSKTHMRLKWAVSSLSEGFPGCLDAPNRFAKISNPLTVTGIPDLIKRWKAENLHDHHLRAFHQVRHGFPHFHFKKRKKKRIFDLTVWRLLRSHRKQLLSTRRFIW